MSSYATAAQSTGISQQHYQRATNPPPDRRTPQEIHYSNYYYGTQYTNIIHTYLYLPCKIHILSPNIHAHRSTTTTTTTTTTITSTE